MIKNFESGVLCCAQTETAQNVVRNLLDFVDRFGFVPNGGRQYYLDRSQPPFLTPMVAALAFADPMRNAWYNTTTDRAEVSPLMPPLIDEFLRTCASSQSQQQQHQHQSDSSSKARRQRPSSSTLCDVEGLVDRIAAAKLVSSSPPHPHSDATATSSSEASSSSSSSVDPLVTPFPFPDLGFISEALPLLEREYAFWMNPRNQHVVSLTRGDGSGRVDQLNRYFVNATSPRPESYAVDIAMSLELNSIQTPQEFFSGLAAGEYIFELKSLVFLVFIFWPCLFSILSGAESGMDFSSRWFFDGFNETSIDTTFVLPVDLNAIMCRVELTLANFYELLGNYPQAKTMLFVRLFLQLISQDTQLNFESGSVFEFAECFTAH